MLEVAFYRQCVAVDGIYCSLPHCNSSNMSMLLGVWWSMLLLHRLSRAYAIWRVQAQVWYSRCQSVQEHRSRFGREESKLKLFVCVYVCFVKSRALAIQNNKFHDCTSVRAGLVSGFTIKFNKTLHALTTLRNLFKYCYSVSIIVKCSFFRRYIRLLLQLLICS